MRQFFELVGAVSIRCAYDAPFSIAPLLYIAYGAVAVIILRQISLCMMVVGDKYELTHYSPVNLYDPWKVMVSIMCQKYVLIRGQIELRDKQMPALS